MKQTNQPHVEPRSVLGRMKPYSPGKPIWEVQRELGLEKVIKLASNENPLGPSPKAVAAIQSYLAGINRYPDADTTDVQKAIAAKLDLMPEQLIITNGADELITLISEAYLETEDEIIVPAPTFSEYEFGAALMGTQVVTVPLNSDYLYDIDAMLAAVTERTKIVYLCSPNNPTGTYLPQRELERLLNALPKHILVVYDAAYSHYVTAQDYTDGLEYVRQGYPIIVLQTFSKIYGLAGIRVGYGAAPFEIIRSIRQVKEPFNVNALAQVGAAAAMTDDEHVHASRELNSSGRDQLYNAFRKLGLPFTESMSNFILVRFGPDAKTMYDKLLATGIIVRYGGAWGLDEYVRISIGTSEENETLIRGLTSILQGQAVRSN